MKIKFMIWNLEVFKTPADLIKVCKDFHIDGVTIKVLNGTTKYNAGKGDPWLKAFFVELPAVGIECEAWGYHYPEQPGAQGDAIMERQGKLGFKVYQLNVEKEWKVAGSGKAFELMVAPIKRDGFYVTVCTYRFPGSHQEMPWEKMDHQVQVDGWTPQVYWALAHNPVDQLNECIRQYSTFSVKPVTPVGATFGQAFKVGDKTVYWMPTNEELVDFRLACKAKGLPEIYYFRLCQVVQKGWWSMLEAATGYAPGTTPPPEPEPELPFDIEIYNLEDQETLRMRRTPGTDPADLVVGRTWNDSPFTVTEIAYDRIGRVWFKVGTEIYLASWYCRKP